MMQRSFCLYKRAVKATGEKHAGEAAVRVRRFAPFFSDGEVGVKQECMR